MLHSLTWLRGLHLGVLLLVSGLVASSPALATARAVVLIDTAVQDWPLLQNALPDDVEVVLLDGQTDGVAAWQSWAAQQSSGSVSALHILSHGQPGTVFLGRGVLNASALAHQTPAWAAMRALFAPQATVMIYGCEVGRGPDGADFVEALSTQLGVPIAASNTRTGSAARGGDWVSEVATGSTVSGSLALVSYPHTLGFVSFTYYYPGTYNGTNGTFAITGTATAAGGGINFSDDPGKSQNNGNGDGVFQVGELLGQNDGWSTDFSSSEDWLEEYIGSTADGILTRPLPPGDNGTNYYFNSNNSTLSGTLNISATSYSGAAGDTTPPTLDGARAYPNNFDCSKRS